MLTGQPSLGYLIRFRVRPNTQSLLNRYNHSKTSHISRTLVGNKIVYHPDVVGASPVAAAPTESWLST